MNAPLIVELTEDMVGAGVDAYRQMALIDERTWFTPRDLIVGVILAAFRESRSGLQVRFQGQLENQLPIAVDR